MAHQSKLTSVPSEPVFQGKEQMRQRGKAHSLIQKRCDSGEVKLPRRTTALVRGLNLVLEHHKAPKSIRDALSNQMHLFLDSSSSEVVWLKRAKHVLAYPIAKYLRNEQPPAPDKVFEPSGPLKDWMKVRLLVFSRTNTHLWYSWYQAKRSSLPASDSFVQTSYETHRSTLTATDPGVQSTMDSIFQDRTFRKVLDDLQRTVAKEFNSSPPDFVSMESTSSACYESTRSKGGQQGRLLHLAKMDMNRLIGSELHSMVDHPRHLRGGGVSWQVLETRLVCGGDEWSLLTSVANDWDCSRKIKCTIQAVLEPFKVRIISKGEALPYYASRPLQKILHSHLRKMDPFRLLGRPLCPTDLFDLAKKAKPTDKWFSIDYSAATDGLSWKYSGTILRWIVAEIRDEHSRDLAMQVLGPHRLNYPDNCCPPGEQTNGQLMGSILSFPILCLANLGVYLLNTQASQVGWTHKERLSHVLVNGDDMVYAGDESLWATHIRIGEDVGLKMSVGKAYVHHEYLNVNSTSIHYNLKRANSKRNRSTPWQIDYLNAGLFFGQHKVQDNGQNGKEKVESDDSVTRYAAAHLGQDPELGIVANLNVVLRGSLPGQQKDLLMSVFRTHRDEIAYECKAGYWSNGRVHFLSRNLFLPQNLGGMGVDRPWDFKSRVNRQQKTLALWSLTKFPGTVTRSLPLPGHTITELESLESGPWIKLRKIFHDFPVVETIFEPGCPIPKFFVRGAYSWSKNRKSFSW